MSSRAVAAAAAAAAEADLTWPEREKEEEEEEERKKGIVPCPIIPRSREIKIGIKIENEFKQSPNEIRPSHLRLQNAKIRGLCMYMYNRQSRLACIDTLHLRR